MLFSPKVSWLVKASDKSLMINFQLKYSILKSDTTTEVGIISCVTQAGSEFLSAAERGYWLGPSSLIQAGGEKARESFRGSFVAQCRKPHWGREDRAQPALSTSVGSSSDTSPYFYFYFFAVLGFVLFLTRHQYQLPSSSLVIPCLMLDVSLQQLNWSSHQRQPQDAASPWNSLSDGKRVPNVLFYYH